MIQTVAGNGIVIINLTSVYCLPCKKEIPELVSISGKAGNKVKLLIIYSEGVKLVNKSASSLGALGYAYVDPLKTIHKKFNTKAVPVTILVDRNYNILGRFVGYTKKNVTNNHSIYICQLY